MTTPVTGVLLSVTGVIYCFIYNHSFIIVQFVIPKLSLTPKVSSAIMSAIHYAIPDHIIKMRTPISMHPWAIAFVICSIQLEDNFVPSSLNANIIISIIPMTVTAKKQTAGNDSILAKSQCILMLPALMIMPIIIKMKPTGIVTRSCLFNSVISLRVPAIIIFHITLQTPASVQSIAPIINKIFL